MAEKQIPPSVSGLFYQLVCKTQDGQVRWESDVDLWFGGLEKADFGSRGQKAGG